MKLIPYASAIGSIKYAMLCTTPIIYLAMSLAMGYNSDLGVDHWITVKIILRYLKRTKEMFLSYGGGKEFVQSCPLLQKGLGHLVAPYLLLLLATRYKLPYHKTICCR